MSQSSIQLLSTAQVIDSLVSSSTIYPLSANQGQLLNAEISALSEFSFVQTYHNSVSGSVDSILLEIPIGSTTSGVSLVWDHTSGQLKLTNNSSSVTAIYAYASGIVQDASGNIYNLQSNGDNTLAVSVSNFFGTSLPTEALSSLNILTAGSSFVMQGLSITISSITYTLPFLTNQYTNSKNSIMIAQM